MRILHVSSRAPWPPRRGNQLRTLQVASALAAGHDVTVLAPGDARAVVPEATPFRFVPAHRGRIEPPFGVVAATLRGDPAECGLFLSRSFVSRFVEFAPAADLVVLELARLAPLARLLPARTPLAVDFVDGLAANLERRAALERPWWRPFWRVEALRMARVELELLARAEAAFVVSERERAGLARRHGPELAGRLSVAPLVVVPRPEARLPESRGISPVIVLTGNLGYFPTASGLDWFLDAVWPLREALPPGVRFVAAGERCPSRLARRLEKAGAEHVASPPDLAAVLAGAGVAVAPLRGGSGVPLKILEAWAAGVPVVATPEAAAAAEGRDGESLLVADRPQEWIDALRRLLDDRSLREKLRKGGVAKLEVSHRPEALSGALAAALRTLSSGAAMERSTPAL